MVVFKASPGFYSGAMYQLSELRERGCFCDVTLNVGSDQLKAHRCVLAVGSQYFNSLFLGQFVEASMQDINLSEVTKDVKALELVINFLYTGEININDDNLGVLVKLATFFLIDPLREFCLSYMLQYLNIRTCLRLYLYAVEHSLADIEKKAKLIVMSRFHDFVILEDDLELSPDEVLFLLSNGIFQHCSSNSILHFVVKWLTEEMTDDHISVANQVLDKTMIKSVRPGSGGSLYDRQKSQTTQMFTKLKETLQNSKSSDADKLLKKSQQAVTKVFPTLEAEGTSKNYNLRLGSPKKSPRSHDKETVVLTLSPCQCVMDAMDQTKPRNFHETITFTEPVFTLCCYMPRTKTWYHMRDFDAEGIMGELSEELYFGGLMSAMYGEELVLMCSFEEVHFYNLRTRSWRMITCNSDADSEDEISSGNDYCFVTGNNRLYLILKVKIFDDSLSDDPSGEYFKGMVFDDEALCWTMVFQTETETTHTCVHSEVRAEISSISNELIFTHGPNLDTGYNYVFVVNLNDPDPAPVNIHKEYMHLGGLGLAGVQISQTRSHFYIVNDGSLIRTVDHLHVVYEYKFNSQTLTRLENELQYSLKINRLEWSDDDRFPCLDKLTASNGKSVWSFEGNEKSVSFLYETVINRNRSVMCTEHTPPPFSCVTGMFVGELPTDLLEQVTPVERFLHCQTPP